MFSSYFKNEFQKETQNKRQEKRKRNCAILRALLTGFSPQGQYHNWPLVGTGEYLPVFFFLVYCEDNNTVTAKVDNECLLQVE